MKRDEEIFQKGGPRAMLAARARDRGDQDLCGGYVADIAFMEAKPLGLMMASGCWSFWGVIRLGSKAWQAHRGGGARFGSMGRCGTAPGYANARGVGRAMGDRPLARKWAA